MKAQSPTKMSLKYLIHGGGEEGREGNKGLIMRITELRYMYYAPINVMPVGGGGEAGHGVGI